VTDPARGRAVAVALAYGEGDVAPRVVAKGEGWIAEAIVEAARRAGVPVRESGALAPALMSVRLDSAIPPALYIAVAEVLAHLARLDPGRLPAATRQGPR
jgi:flagellar biosynthesis protein